MRRWIAISALGTLLLAMPLPVLAQQVTFNVLRTSTARFKTEAPLETIVGTTAGPTGVTGMLMVDPAKPEGVTGTIKVDLTTIKTGIDKRDADMRGKDFLDTDNDANRYAVFDLKGAEIGGPLVPGKEVPVKVKGTLTIKGKPVDLWAEARVMYVKLTPEQLETQKRWGFTSDNIVVKAKFDTSFTNHGMQVPQLLFLKVSNDIQIETDLILVRQ